MVAMVTCVATLIHIYSVGYMSHEPTTWRFFSYLSLFTFAMLMLVTADNLLQLFFGWEGVGLASYLLIGYWYYKPSACARRDQGVHRQPHRRPRLRRRHRVGVLDLRLDRIRGDLRRRAAAHERHLPAVRRRIAPTR